MSLAITTDVVRTAETGMSKDFEIRGAVRGTPRTYGDRRTEDVWRQAIVGGRWTGHEGVTFPLTSDVELRYEFGIHAASADYGLAPFPNGRDLDTLVVQSSTSAALIAGRNTQRPSLRWIGSGQLVRRVLASKHLVCTDDEAGAVVIIRPARQGAPPLVGERVLSFEVPAADVRQLGLGEAVKRHVALANRDGIVFSGTARIALSLVFRETQPAVNLLSEALLEKAIDAIGASPVAGRRLFEESRGSRPGVRDDTDDSIVFALVAEKTDALPQGVLLRGDVWQAPTSSSPETYDFLG